MRRGEEDKRLSKDEVDRLYSIISKEPKLPHFLRLSLVSSFLLQTGCRSQSVFSLSWSSIDLLTEGGGGDNPRPFLSITLAIGKCQASGVDRHARLRRHDNPTHCAVGALALQRANLLDIDFYEGELSRISLARR